MEDIPMREVDRRGKYSRRIFLQGAATAIPVVAVASSTGIGIEDAWAADATTLAPQTLKTLVKVARDIYPHDFLVDSYYITAIKPWDGKAAKDPAVKALLEDGVRRLNQDALDRHKLAYVQVPWEADRIVLLQGIEQTDFFQKVRSDLVVSLYNQEELWPNSATRAHPPSMAATSIAASTTSIGCRKSKDFGQNEIGWEDIMAKFDLNDDGVVVIIGSGAGGGTLGNELAQKGVKVVILEAGPRTELHDFINNEWESFTQLAWTDMRTTSGNWRVAKDFANLPAWIVKSVGGSTVHWAGASLRFDEHEFRIRSAYGNVPGANLLDWPITLAEMEPWYAKAEDKMGVTRTNNIPGLPGNNNFKVMEAGAKKLGYKEVHTGRMAINSEPRDGRGSCQQIGFCFQGCKSGAKWSTLYSEIPKGEATGNLEVRPSSMALQIEHDASGKVVAVIYADEAGNNHRQKARIVAVAGNSIESPRLLLNSASSTFPDGLANSSGQVGRNYMRHMTGSVYAVFDKSVHMYRGTTMAGIIRDEARHDPSRGFMGGYEMETLSLGLPFMAAFLNPGAWGRPFTAAMEGYPRMAGMWLVGEDLPQETNRVTLDPKAKDKFGLPVASVHYDDHPNDIAMRDHAYKQGSAVYEAIGATVTYPTTPYPSTHNMGTNRMSAKAKDGVVNKFGQTHDVKNLFVSDGSQFTSGAACNPTLTIVALAVRQADHIAGAMQRKEI